LAVQLCPHPKWKLTAFPRPIVGLREGQEVGEKGTEKRKSGRGNGKGGKRGREVED